MFRKVTGAWFQSTVNALEVVDSMLREFCLHLKRKVGERSSPPEKWQRQSLR